MDDRFLIVWCSCPDAATAHTIAERLVEQRLAACATLLPGARSVYHWQGKVESAEETLLMIKTHGTRYAALEAAIQTLHPYEVPEVLAVEVTDGVAPYLDWVRESTA